MTSNKKLLMVGCGYADIPLVISAKQMGYYVITTGNRPHDLGHAYSDEYHYADYSDCQAIYKLAEKLEVSAICPCCNDFAALSAAYAAEKLGLPGHDPYETAQILHHKDLYRRFAMANDIPTPQARGFDSRPEAWGALDTIPLPGIVKPVDLTGGKGVSVINHKNEARTAIDRAFSLSKAQRIVIEQYIAGSRHGFSAFIHQGKVSFYFSDNEHYYINPYLVAAASTPSIVSPATEQSLCMEVEKIAFLLSLKDGIFHVQFILAEGQPVIIEICRRPPGDLYIQLVKYATGIDYPGWIVKAFAGLDCSLLEQAPVRRYITRHCIMSSRPGIVKDIIFDKNIESKVIDRFVWGQRGDTVDDVMTSKLGIVFLEFNSITEMLDITPALNELIKVEIH